MNIRYANAYLMLVLVSDWSILVCQQLNVIKCPRRKYELKYERILNSLNFDDSSERKMKAELDIALLTTLVKEHKIEKMRSAGDLKDC